MKRSYQKIIGRSIKKSMGRFLSVFAITALGVGFLAGLISTTPDMKYTIDRYYDENGFFDIFMKSTGGFTEEDVDAVNSLDEISQAKGCYVMDALMEDGEGESHTARLTGTDFAELQDKDSDPWNRLSLTEGRLPENEGECVIEYTKPGQVSPAIGDSIGITDENEDVEDTYQVTEYQVVGIVESPEFFSLEDEPTTIGNGKISLFVYVGESAFSLDYYTEIQAQVAGAEEKNTFKDAYQDKIDRATDDLESLAVSREAIRFQQIRDEANEKLNEKKADYKEEKTKTLKKIFSAQKKIDEGKQEIEDGEKEISDGEKEIKENKEKLSEGKQKLESGQKEIDKGKKEIAAAKKKLATAKKELKTNREKAKKELGAARTKLESGKKELAEKEKELQAAKETLGEATVAKEQAKLDAAKKKLAAQEKELITSEKKSEAALKKAEQQITDSEKKITANEKKIEASEKELSESKEKLDKGEKELTSAQKSIKESKNKLKKAKEKIKTSQKKLDGNTEKAEKEFAKAEKKIQDAEDKIADIENVTWYILDRNSNVSYASFSANVDKVASIAKVFPVFFFLIAALVVLTTMTRMVEEERTEIGVLKALGYSSATIASKYLIYAALAAVLGSVAGLLAGTRLFPTVLWNAYGIMYDFPELVCLLNPVICIGTSAVLIVGVLGATLYASVGAMKEKPATLMLPKAPKPGKRVFLEYIGPLWRHMKFTYKVTARNLLRYKKRFFMTILGVAGCTALLVTGFGLRDSIGDIVEVQYGVLQKYDLQIQTDEEWEGEESILTDFLTDSSYCDGYIRMHESGGKLYGGKGKGDITLTIPEDTEMMEEFRTLRERQTGAKIPFDSQSVLLTEKIASRLGISAGDTITIKNSDDKKAEFTVTGVVENYISSRVFMGKDAYKDAYGTDPEYLFLDVKSHADNAEDRDALSEELLNDSSITGLQFSAERRETFSNMLGRIDYIVVVLIICAGLLAFIVLYDLTNINVSEREKEIATIKVLGFYDREVSAYIYRETVVLSILGTFLGLGLGIFLHAFVVRTAEMDSFMFGRQIYPLSFVLAAVITMLFSMIVNLVMGRKMKKIDMAESMKAVD